MAVSDSKTLDLFQVGLIVMSFGGAGVHFSWFNVSNLFPRYKKTVSSMVVGSFTISGLVFVAYDGLSAAGVTRQQLFVTHAVVNAAVCLLAALWWPTRPFNLGDVVTFTSPVSYTITATAAKTAAPAATAATALVLPGTPGKIAADGVQKPAKELAQSAAVLQAKPAPKQQHLHSDWLAMGISDQLRLPSFVSMVVFFSVNHLGYVFYVGTALDQLERFGDHDQSYLRTLSWVMPCGCLSVPFFGWVLDNCSFSRAFGIVNTLGLLSAVLSLVENLQLQVLRFVLFALFRTCLFSGTFAYVAANYGFKRCGCVHCDAE